MYGTLSDFAFMNVAHSHALLDTTVQSGIALTLLCYSACHALFHASGVLTHLILFYPRLHDVRSK